MYYIGGKAKRNGVGIVVRGELSKTVVEVIRVDDRLMAVRLQVKGCMLFVVSAYAPQTGCTDGEKEHFREELQKLVNLANAEEVLMVFGDMNAHVGEDRTGYEECLGKHGKGTRNAEGEALLDMCIYNQWMIVNTWFEKRKSQLITYRSGKARTQIDFLLVRKAQWKWVKDCKVVPSETVAPQHKPVVVTMDIVQWRREELCSPESRLRLWKLKGTGLDRFKNLLIDKEPRDEPVGEVDEEWNHLKSTWMEAAEKVCGWAKLGKPRKRDEWWWGEEVQEAVKEKKELRRQFEMDPSVENGERYSSAKKKAKWKVKKAKEEALDDLYEELSQQPDIARKKIYSIAKTRQRSREDNITSPFVNDESGKLQVVGEDVKGRWKEYFEKLLNEENPFTAQPPHHDPIKAPLNQISHKQR